MEIKLSRCAIRPWQPGDEESLVRHANNRKIWLNVRDAFPHPYTMEDAVGWIEKANEPPVTNFAIVVESEAVGGVGMILKDDIYRRSAEVGYWLGEQFWGRGLVTEAVRAIIEYAFENFDLCRLYAGVLEWNPASMKVLEKAGFQLEARLRKAVTKDNQTMDEFIYAIIKE